MQTRSQSQRAAVTTPPVWQRRPLFPTRPFASPGAQVAPVPQEAPAAPGTPGAGYHFADLPVRGARSTPPTAVQRATAGMAGLAAPGPSSAPPLAARPHQTGLPDHLKAGIEALSGMALDTVRVHYQSAKPAEFQALAYTQGTDIHIAPGQEQHLPHEAWHVVQQAQGRVPPMLQLKDGVSVNDDKGLEHEAAVMGTKALQRHRPEDRTGAGAEAAMAVQWAGETREAAQVYQRVTAHGGALSPAKATAMRPVVSPLPAVVQMNRKWDKRFKNTFTLGIRKPYVRYRRANRPVIGQQPVNVIGQEPMNDIDPEPTHTPLTPIRLPEDSRGGLADIRIQQGKTEITAKDLQIGLIEELSTVGEKGFGYRLLSFRYDRQGLHRDDSEYYKEKHGMQPWPAAIDKHVGDITLLVQATLTAAGQLQYLQDNFQDINATHDIIVDVDWYRERTQSDVGFHKDSRGTTLFVNLTYNNAEAMQGASTKPDLEGQKALEEKLPLVVRNDLDERRKSYGNPQSGEVTETAVGPYARLSFADPSIWHSTPLLGHRIERVQPPTDVQTLETYLPRAGYPEYIYRGILEYYPSERYKPQTVFDYFREQRKSQVQREVKSAEQLEEALRTLGMTDDDLYGYYRELNTIEDFWKALKGIDRYNKHGISEEIKAQNAEQLTADVKNRRRPLSQRLDKESDLQGALDEEAKRPRTFIRTWVRLVPRPK